MVAQVGDNWFSFCRRGEALMIHFASRDPRNAPFAARTFCEWAFEHYPWCRMLIATIRKRSVIKLARHCGFIEFARDGDRLAMMRMR